jgi:hypothetical protein
MVVYSKKLSNIKKILFVREQFNFTLKNWIDHSKNNIFIFSSLILIFYGILNIYLLLRQGTCFYRSMDRIRKNICDVGLGGFIW